MKTATLQLLAIFATAVTAAPATGSAAVMKRGAESLAALQFYSEVPDSKPYTLQNCCLAQSVDCSVFPRPRL